MSHKTILAVASAVLLSASAAAMAAESNHSVANGPMSTSAMSSDLHGIRNAVLIGKAGPASLLGRPVLNWTGYQIGEVGRIVPGGVVISVREVGGGGHHVLLQPDQLTVTRHRGGLAVISSLNEGQLNKMSAYKGG